MGCQISVFLLYLRVGVLPTVFMARPGLTL